MMNSYGFDQPLDLRLKALNLSLVPPFQTNHQHQHHHHNYYPQPTTYGQIQLPPPSLPVPHYYNFTDYQIVHTSSPATSLLSTPPISHQPPPSQPRPPAAAPQHLISSPTHNNHNFQLDANTKSQLRSTNIHCQPLNHHQPHPLASRLNPQVFTPTGHVNKQQQQQHSGLTATSSPTTHHQSLSGAAVMSSSQNTALAAQNLSHQMQTNQLPPLCRAGSFNPQLGLKSPITSSSDPVKTNHHHNQTTFNHSQFNNNNINIINSNSNNNNNNLNSTPITRQNSLVSRYNCKPCGIVFSQPETLRAHQEGYCKERDRYQNQIRSQSAVSPMTNNNRISTASFSDATEMSFDQ